MENDCQLVVRKVNRNVMQEFKAQATMRGATMGQAVTAAMIQWIDRERKQPTVSLLDLKPVAYGSRHASQEIDKEVYG